jgi:hypothetical protein
MTTPNRLSDSFKRPPRSARFRRSRREIAPRTGRGTPGASARYHARPQGFLAWLRAALSSPALIHRPLWP